MPRRVPRLVDLHVNWLSQYAPETELFGPGKAERIGPALAQAEGYLSTASAAVIAVARDSDDWLRQPDPWRSLGDLIARVEAEFSGRILIAPDDVDRWRDDPDGMTWAVLGVAGFDALIRDRHDLDRVPSLFARGVRVFQPIAGATSGLGGSSHGDPEHGLTSLGRDFLQVLSELAPSAAGPRPALDLVQMSPRSLSDTLDWLEADDRRGERIVPLFSHGTPEHSSFPDPRALGSESLHRLRKLGGWIGLTLGPPFHGETASFLRILDEIAAIPFRHRAGYEGIAIGSNLLGLASTLPGLTTAFEIRDWLLAHLPEGAADAVIHDNAASLCAQLAGKS